MKRLLLAAALIASTALAAEPQRVPGTGVSLSPPPGFVAAKQFAGFMSPTTNASIVVSELDGPFSLIERQAVTPEGLSSQGMSLLKREDIEIDGQRAILLQVGQQAHDMSFVKWMLVLGDEQSSVLAVATFPEAKMDSLSEPLKQSLLSAQWDRSVRPDFWEGISFRIDEVGDFKLAKKAGNNVVLTRNAEFPLKSTDAPLIVVGASITDTLTIGDRSAFARERLEQTTSFKDYRILEEEDLDVAGLSGRRILAEAKHVRDDTDKFLYFGILYNEGAYYLFLASSNLDRRAQYEQLFDQAMRSFRLAST
jgi:hypothetical protein